MKTSIIDVDGLLSVLSAREVERQLSTLTGVKKAEGNYVAGSSALVAVNALLIKRTRLEEIRQAADTRSSGELTAERMGA